MPHALDHAERHLWRTLADDKRPLALLIGAGSAMAVPSPADAAAPLIKGIEALTKAATEAVLGTGDATAFQSLKSAIVAAESREPNIEDLLTWLRTLGGVVGDGELHGVNRASIRAIETTLMDKVVSEVSANLPEDTPFDNVAQWARHLRRLTAINIFTTNYDLLIEQALERAFVPYFDGFVGSHHPFLDTQAVEDDDLPARWVRLWKLHGSINWSVDELTKQVVRVGDSKASPPLIYPSHLKYDQSRRGPYFIMQDRLRTFMKLPCATLVTNGYRFGDEHVNELVVHGAQANPTAVVFALLHGPRTRYPEAFQLAAKTPNLLTFADDAASIAGEADDWEPGTSSSLGDFNAFGRGLMRLLAWDADEFQETLPRGRK